MVRRPHRRDKDTPGSFRRADVAADGGNRGSLADLGGERIASACRGQNRPPTVDDLIRNRKETRWPLSPVMKRPGNRSTATTFRAGFVTPSWASSSIGESTPSP